MKANHLIEQLAQSAIYRDYERSFVEATGMPLALRPVESWNLAHHGRRHENPFCAMLAAASPACSACLDAQKRVCNPAAHEPQSAVCFAGLREAAVPVRAGERLLGFLQTGEVIVGQPNRRRFARVVRQLRTHGVKLDVPKLEQAYFHTKTLTLRQYQSVLRLLAIFAQHLGLVANHLAIRARHSEPESVVKARKFIEDHHGAHLALGDVSRAVNMSTFYFCKVFKKATGLTFTEYVSRVRLDKARQMLVNPNVRISEAAFEAGFQSLTHFNRTFHRLLGESPTKYRAALPK